MNKLKEKTTNHKTTLQKPNQPLTQNNQQKTKSQIAPGP